MLITYFIFLFNSLLMILMTAGRQPARQLSATNQSNVAVMQIRAAGAEENTLTAAEKAAAWQLLFDGKTHNGWRGVNQKTFPEQGWKIENGELVVLKTDGDKARQGGDIITTGQFDDFELTLEAKLTAGGNSGLKYFVTERKGSAIGLEFQLLDDDRHPDAKMGKNGNRTIGSLYDLIPAQNKKGVPVGEWNKIRLIVRQKHVEHWLNGSPVVSFERGSPAFRQLVAESKYKKYKNFGEAAQGYILLQDHGDEVHFRNIKIRIL
ncbi:MAG: hypothetical protein JWQ14_3622 [Adhaeribacter sp.]|nr:hypothetical protein [Adhaeribacter sp.]